MRYQLLKARAKKQKFIKRNLKIKEDSDDSLSDDDKLEKVRKVADALTELYAYEDGYEMGVSYYINHDQYVNS